jgi:hypothetical protein
MPSAALHIWNTDRRATLDEIEQAHRAVGGIGPGRRYATLQINHAYTVLLSSQFQGFCRDLHTEAAEIITGTLPLPLQPLMRDGLLRDRRLDRGNPSPGNIGEDFSRFDVRVWPAVYLLDARNRRRNQLLEQMNLWRNAIAHQDFTRLGGMAIQLRQVRQWRNTCQTLAVDLDEIIRRQLVLLTGVSPW